MNRNAKLAAAGMAVVGLLAGLLLGYLFLRNNTEPEAHAFDGLPVGNQNWASVSRKITDSCLGAFRKNLAFAALSLHPKGKSYCIVHEPESALDYDINTFPSFRKYHSAKPGYKWSVGLYPEICLDTMQDGVVRPRISIFMIPTMRNADIKNHTHDILDYDSLKNTKDSLYYEPDSIRNKSAKEIELVMYGSGGGVAYDQGTVFP